MKSLGCLIQAALDKGAFLTIGAGCLILHKLQYFPDILQPKILVPLSYGIFSIGALGVVRYILMDSDKADNSDYEEVLRVLGKQTSEIKANRKEIEELRESCVRFFSMREILEAGQLNPALLEDRITILQRLQRSPDEETSLYASKGSTQETLSDIREYRGSSAESRVEADATAGSGYADKKKFENLHKKQGETLREIKLELPREEILKYIRLDIFRHLGMIVPDDFYEKMNGSMNGYQSGKINAKISEKQQMELYEKALEEVTEMVLVDTAENVLADIFYEVLGELSANILEEISAKVEVEMSERMQAEMAKMDQEVTEEELQAILLKVQFQISEAVDDDVCEKLGLKVPENSADYEERKRLELYQQMLTELNECDLYENVEKATEGELNIEEDDFQESSKAECGESLTFSEKGQEKTEKLEGKKLKMHEVSNEGSVAEIKKRIEALEKTKGIVEENIPETGDDKRDATEQKMQ